MVAVMMLTAAGSAGATGVSRLLTKGTFTRAVVPPGAGRARGQDCAGAVCDRATARADPAVDVTRAGVDRAVRRADGADEGVGGLDRRGVTDRRRGRVVVRIGVPAGDHGVAGEGDVLPRDEAYGKDRASAQGDLDHAAEAEAPRPGSSVALATSLGAVPAAGLKSVT